MPVRIPDHERRFTVGTAYLNDLHRVLGVADHTPVHSESIPYSCLHDPPPSAATTSLPRLSPGRKSQTHSATTDCVNPSVRCR
jgi:hypothetical protein